MKKKTLKLSPCNMVRVVNCPFSIRYNPVKEYDADIDYNKKPIYNTDATARGIVAHRYAAAILSNDNKELLDLPTYPAFTEKLAENVMRYVEYICSIMPPQAENPKLKVEYNLKNGQLDWLYTGCYGRTDAVIDADNDLYIIDMKYGNEYVDAYKNYQLLAYAVGIETESLAANKTKQRHKNIHIIVYHAFTGEPSVWTITRDEAAAITDYMKIRIDEALTNAQIWQAGTHCEHCPQCAQCGAWVNWIITGEQCGSYPEIETDTDIKNNILQLATEWLDTRGKADHREMVIKFVINNIIAGNVPSKTVKTTEYYVWDDKEYKYIINQLKKAGFNETDVTETKPLTPTQLKKKFGDNPKLNELIAARAKKVTRNTIKNN